MNDIADAKASFAEQATIFRRKHNWLMCLLYLGTFGSFIGYAAGFPLLIKSQFPGVNPLAYAWLGPLVGAVVRPLRRLARRQAGRRARHVLELRRDGAGGASACWTSSASAAGRQLHRLLPDVPGAVLHHRHRQRLDLPHDPGDLPDQALARRRAGAPAAGAATRKATPRGAATLGFTAAIAAYGGFFIPKSYGTSISLTGGPQAALYVFFVFYLSCIAVTWWVYARRGRHA